MHGRAYILKRWAHTHVSRWIIDLRRAGLDYDIVILERSEDLAQLADLECYWIAFGRACGWPLTNLTDGGDGTSGRVKSATECEKIRQSKLGKPRPDLAALNKARTGWKQTQEARAKVSRAQRGLKRSAQTRARMSAASKLRMSTPEARADVAARNRVRWSDLSARAKYSANNPMRDPVVVARCLAARKKS